MDTIVTGLFLFWFAVSVGGVSTMLVLPLLRRMNTQRTAGGDRKTTMYGAEAVEFNRIRQAEESRGVKKEPVPRLGGLTLLPTVALLGVGVSVYANSSLLLVCVLFVCAAALVMVYDDCADVGIIPRRPIRVRHRLLLLAVVGLVGGFGMYMFLPAFVTFLPFPAFESVYVGWLLIPLFAVWCIFWQISSVIDGIDGLSGSIFLVLFSGTTIVSFLQGNSEAFLLSLLGAGILIPWLCINYAPAKAYLTETGITILLFLFSTISFLLAADGGLSAGLWTGCIFGLILIITWCSVAVQLVYRKKTGKKLLRIAPIHHHFEAGGMPGSAVVLRYTLFTLLCVLVGLSLMIFI